MRGCHDEGSCACVVLEMAGDVWRWLRMSEGTCVQVAKVGDDWRLQVKVGGDGPRLPLLQLPRDAGWQVETSVEPWLVRPDDTKPSELEKSELRGPGTVERP